MNILPPAAGTIGATVAGVKLDAIGDAEARQIKETVYRHRMVVIKGQDLTPAQFIHFGNRVGEVKPYLQANYHHPEHPEIFVSSNVVRHGQRMGVARTGGYWHTDTAFQPEPHIFTILSPRIVPAVRRSTHFLDMGVLYRALPDRLRERLDGLSALHSGRWRYKVRAEDAGLDITEILQMIDRLAPPAVHPAVIEHPVTRERALYVSSGFTIGFEGLSAAENIAFREELFAFLERAEHIQEAVWEAGDIIIWDNRLVCHRSGREIPPPGYVREMAEVEPETMVFRLTALDEHPLTYRGRPSA